MSAKMLEFLILMLPLLLADEKAVATDQGGSLGSHSYRSMEPTATKALPSVLRDKRPRRCMPEPHRG